MKKLKRNYEFEELLPGTKEWLYYWQDNPDEQQAMIEFAKKIKRRKINVRGTKKGIVSSI